MIQWASNDESVIAHWIVALLGPGVRCKKRPCLWSESESKNSSTDRQTSAAGDIHCEMRADEIFIYDGPE